ncbi:hypothetical protein BJ875DRAFT_545138 [Amylocarpus encephaloides]|uniref:NOT2/NOT3/NOT5 C-terminal domain-containing protein n=1 Tax=Amylocarpus encephaloides TaxID=45428 RepID=A0A9P8C369_9HELO|nr:hypothetical protein BJ875DRAFT_545138 [Amylocarpus encephaloides]
MVLEKELFGSMRLELLLQFFHPAVDIIYLGETVLTIQSTYIAIGPQSLRGLPNGFSSQQQLPQNRVVSNRLPPGGKMAGNGATWAFGGGIPMGNAGLGNPRPNIGPMSSFAQTIGGSSQAAASLDLSEFPSLSNNQPQPSQSTWAASGSRNPIPPANLRMQQSSLSSQQQLNAQQAQQDDLFNTSSQLPSSQGAFRFGSQNTVGQPSQSNSAEEFPPLSRNANGDIGPDRGSSMMQDVAFGAQANGLGFGSANPPQTSRNNGLLNALSGSSRGAAVSNRIASPNLSGVSNSRSPINGSRSGPSGGTEDGGVGESQSRSNQAEQLKPFSNTLFPQTTTREENNPHPTTSANVSSRPDGPQPQLDGLGARAHGADASSTTSQNATEEAGPEVQDALAHMADIDRWGLKGWSFMMNNFPDYSALVNGSSITNLGFDLNSSEPFSTEVYSLWDNEPSRPAVPQFDLPECYTVLNVNTLDTKIQNFNDEALIFMFYSNPGDMQQLQAAQELHTRNWRYHKKLQQWLTKDDMMVPQTLGNGTERGYYIFFDIKLWQRERRELTLIYDDLESLPGGTRGTLA